MKRLILGVLAGMLILTSSCVSAEGTETYYCWGIGFNRVVGNSDQKFIQINGDVRYKFPNNKWLKDTYVYMGVNLKGNFTGGVGYYLWTHQVGLQVGNIYSPNSMGDKDSLCCGIFLGSKVIDYFLSAILNE